MKLEDCYRKKNSIKQNEPRSDTADDIAPGFIASFSALPLVLHRSLAKLLFEYVLEIGLAGIAEIGADLREAAIAVGQQIAGILQLIFLH